MRCCLVVGVCLLIVCLGFKCWWNVGLGCLGCGFGGCYWLLLYVVLMWWWLVGLDWYCDLGLLCLFCFGFIVFGWICLWVAFVCLVVLLAFCYLDLCGFVYISCVVLLCGLVWLLGFDFTLFVSDLLLLYRLFGCLLICCLWFCLLCGLLFCVVDLLFAMMLKLFVDYLFCFV